MARRSLLTAKPAPRAARFQMEECLLVYHLLQANSIEGVMVDAGAHFGTSLKPFAHAGWTVWAFEPDDNNRARLKAAAETDPASFANVHISPLALSDEEQTDLAFFGSEVSTGISSLSPFHETHRETQKVSTTTLTKFALSHDISRIDFLKIDVEGTELLVLQGVDFKIFKPRSIIAEFEDAKTQRLSYDRYSLADFLVGNGYAVFVSEWYPIERYGTRHSWRSIRRYPCEISEDGWGNLIALDEVSSMEAVEEAAAKALDTAGTLSSLRRFASRLRGMADTLTKR